VTVLRARLNLGVYLSQGDPCAAFENDRAGLAEARRLGQRRMALLFLANAAEDATWTGDWDWALPELEELLAGDLEREDRLQVLAPLVRVRAWRGDGVDELLDELERLARQTSEAMTLYTAAVARADRALAIGELEETAAAYRRAAVLSSANAPLCHVLAARIAFLARDPASAAPDLAALEATGIHGPAIKARRTSIRAGLAALDGRPAEALSLYRDAIRRFRDLGLPVDEAFTAIEMATLLDPTESEVRAATDAAHEILTRLRGRPFLDQLKAATRLQSSPPVPERSRLRDTSSV
jgi:tetratricopeptide (TPR) repeat protein